MKLKGMIFDMDGVITSSSHEHFLAWREVADRLGFSLADEVEELTKGVSRMASLEVVLQAGGRAGDYSSEEKTALAAQKNRRYQELIRAFTPDHLLPGVLDLFKECRLKGMKTALASASENGPLLMERLEIEEYFDAVINPAELKAGKPAPDIFLAAAEALGVAADQCAGVEDAIAGVEAIKSAGMFAVGIGNPRVLAQADVVFPDCRGIDLKEINKQL